MWDAIKSAAKTAHDVVLSFFASALFFTLVGCGFFFSSYILLNRLLPCIGRPFESGCLYLTQVNLAFGFLCGLIGTAFLIYGAALHAVAIGQISRIKRVYDELKVFFGSPIFFIILGCLFLYFGLTLLDETHSSFVFILSILGISMILFGTGSQAVASAEMPTTVKLNATIAGGAAAIAAIFGYGSVLLEDGIKGFFKRNIDYGYLDLSTTSGSTQAFKLDDHNVSASMADGTPLPLSKQSSTVHIVVPRYSSSATTSVYVTIQGPYTTREPSGLLMRPYPIDWKKAEIDMGFGNEKMFISRQSFQLAATTETRTFNEQGKEVVTTPISAK